MNRKRGLALFAALLLLGFSVTVFAPPKADALPACGTHYNYYNNCTDCVQIGQKYYDCNGVLQSSWGSFNTTCVTQTTYCCPIEA
ncbi:MAG TPA: hypothetical protein VLE27_05280 [Thermoanaerobaculia bacterium]|nr:hypothetical protein [Thermoanaerobaculia bacterium]